MHGLNDYQFHLKIELVFEIEEGDEMKYIHYRKGYKYQIQKKYVVNIDITPKKEIDTDHIKLTKKGLLTIKKGYAWDGPSGPAIDTRNFMRGSLVHDALYQLMRERCLNKKKYRKLADKILRKMCKEDGMVFIRSFWVYIAVRIFADPSADPANKKPVIRAPKSRKR